jgi:hypothetical protein
MGGWSLSKYVPGQTKQACPACGWRRRRVAGGAGRGTQGAAHHRSPEGKKCNGRSSVKPTSHAHPGTLIPGRLGRAGGGRAWRGEW